MSPVWKSKNPSPPSLPPSLWKTRDDGNLGRKYRTQASADDECQPFHNDPVGSPLQSPLATEIIKTSKMHPKTPRMLLSSILIMHFMAAFVILVGISRLHYKSIRKRPAQLQRSVCGWYNETSNIGKDNCKRSVLSIAFNNFIGVATGWEPRRTGQPPILVGPVVGLALNRWDIWGYSQHDLSEYVNECHLTSFSCLSEPFPENVDVPPTIFRNPGYATV